MPEMKLPAATVLDASKGMAQKELSVIFTSPVNGPEPVLKNLDDHVKFQVDLECRGIMFGAGPFWDDDETHWSGEDMVIVWAESLAAARTIAAEDPMHQRGARRFTVRPRLLNDGTLTRRLNVSEMKYRIE